MSRERGILRQRTLILAALLEAYVTPVVVQALLGG